MDRRNEKIFGKIVFKEDVSVFKKWVPYEAYLFDQEKKSPHWSHLVWCFVKTSKCEKPIKRRNVYYLSQDQVDSRNNICSADSGERRIDYDRENRRVSRIDSYKYWLNNNKLLIEEHADKYNII